MSTGVERAAAQPFANGTDDAEAGGWPPADAQFVADEAEHENRGGRRRLLAAALVLLALGWIGAAGYALFLAPPAPDLPAWVGAIAALSGPLVLIGLLWLLFGRSPRRETERFTRAVAEMRRESEALEQLLQIVGGRIEENRSRLAEESARLMALGDEASDRLGRVTHYLARESAELERRATALDGAAESARIDIGVLMADLPQAEAQARAAAAAMKEAGLAAHAQAAGLEGQLAAVTARAREADEQVGGGAQRLAAHVARIDSGAGAALERMNAAAAQMDAAVDGAMARAAEAVDQTRAGLEAQGQAMLALIEQSRAAFEAAGAETSRKLAERLDTIGERMSALAGQLAAQDAASQSLLSNLARRLGDIDAQLAELGRSGSAQNEALGAAIDTVRTAAAELHGELDGGRARAEDLDARAKGLADTLGALTRQLREELPQALGQVETQAGRTATAADGTRRSVEAVQAAAALTAQSLTDGEATLSRQHESLAALMSAVETGVRQAEERLGALAAAVAETDGAAERMVGRTGPELIDTLVRVREAANQAAAHAREAIAAAIPDSVAALTAATGEALSAGVGDAVRAQLGALETASQRAVDSARQASERLTRQLLAIAQTAAAIEARIEEDRESRAEQEAEATSRRVALLIEALNSTAIDVTKILSNEVTDTAWTAYLKGDRGVFTRRAVRLLDSGEAREIQRHYEEEPEFREQVNRYVHDFEAMLRRVLADRDGTPMGVTLLSSDMGKLYVALAQAIERLR